MKNVFLKAWLCAIICSAALFTSCSSGPENADTVQTKSWVFRNCLSTSYQNSLREEFLNRVRMGHIGVEGMEDFTLSDVTKQWYDADEISFKDACALYFYHDMDFPTALSHQKSVDRLSFEDIEGWSFFSYKYKEEVLHQDPARAISILLNLYTAFCNYLDQVAEQEVSLLNTSLEENVDSDSYIGYLVEYEVGRGYYALIELVEFNNNGRYQVEILYDGDSLSDLHDIYQWTNLTD